MTIDQIRPAYRLWWKLNHTLETFSLALQYLHEGNFEGVALQLQVGGFPCKPWSGDDWEDELASPNLAAAPAEQTSLFEAAQ
jgi:hypothetical protein